MKQFWLALFTMKYNFIVLKPIWLSLPFLLLWVLYGFYRAPIFFFIYPVLLFIPISMLINLYMTRIKRKISLLLVICLYVMFSTAIIIPTTAYFGYPSFHRNPIYGIKEYQQYIKYINSYSSPKGLFDSEYHLKISYDDNFVDLIVEKLGLSSYSNKSIPDEFWNIYIFWWQPMRMNDARAYKSIRFDFINRGNDGDHFFIYDMPSERVCYIWYKQNF